MVSDNSWETTKHQLKMFVSQWKMGGSGVRVDLPGLKPDDGVSAGPGAGYEDGGHGEGGDGGQRGLHILAEHHRQGEVGV